MSPQKNSNIKILYVENEQEQANLVANYLSKEGLDVALYLDGELGLAAALSNEHFDVILLNLKLPQINGFDVLKTLRRTNLAPVILLTENSDEFDCLYGFEIGADDYLAKPFSQRELLVRVKALTRRTQYNAGNTVNTTMRIGPMELNNQSQSLCYKQQKVLLTSTEYSIIELLALQRGHRVSKAAISQKVFERPLKQYDRSIDMHISNIRKKLSALTALEAIRTVRPQGYMLIDVWH